MKFSILAIFWTILFVSCQTQPPAPTENSDNSLTFEKNEEDEYDIIVLDPQYDVYLMTIARPESYYSENYYKMKNQQFVNTWNNRHSQPFRYDTDLYAVRIDYDPKTNYGLKLEYKLYNFFKFIEWKYKVNLSFGG